MSKQVLKSLVRFAYKGDLNKVREIIETHNIDSSDIHGPYNQGSKQEEIFCKACKSGNLELVKYLYEYAGEFFLAAPVIDDEHYEDEHYYAFAPMTYALSSGNMELAEYMLIKTKNWVGSKNGLVRDFNSSLHFLVYDLTYKKSIELIMLIDKHDCLAIALDDNSDMDPESRNEHLSYVTALNSGQYELFELFMCRLKINNPHKTLRRQLNKEALKYLSVS